MRPIEKILVPTDFSQTAADAIEHAYSLARSLGARVTLLHVYPPPSYEGPDDTASSDAGELARRADTALHDLAHAAGRYAIAPPSTIAVEGEPAEQIVRIANEGGFDAIIIGTHGRTGLARVVIGSVAEQVVRRARCPVMTVRSAGRHSP